MFYMVNKFHFRISLTSTSASANNRLIYFISLSQLRSSPTEGDYTSTLELRKWRFRDAEWLPQVTPWAMSSLGIRLSPLPLGPRLVVLKAAALYNSWGIIDLHTCTFSFFQVIICLWHHLLPVSGEHRVLLHNMRLLYPWSLKCS